MDARFDTVIERKGTRSVKYDGLARYFGHNLPDDILPLWVADMDFPVAEEILTALHKRLEHGILGYSSIDRHWQEVAAAWLNKRYNFAVSADWIVYSPGIVPALSTAILAFTEPGDEIISFTPVYTPFYGLVREHERRFVACPLIEEGEHYALDFAKLALLLSPKSKALLLCSPHNPAGRLWTEPELKQLADFALKHNLLIFSDEIHADFVYEGKKHFPLAALAPEIAPRTFTCFAPSKSFNIAGLASSAIVIPDPKMREEFTACKAKLHLNGNIFGYEALEAAWTLGEPWLNDLIRYLEDNRNYLLAELNLLRPWIRAWKPEAGFLLWLDCRALMDKLKMQKQAELEEFFLHQCRLALNSGTEYGKEAYGFMRLNFGCPRSTLREAIQRIQTVLATI